MAIQQQASTVHEDRVKKVVEMLQNPLAQQLNVENFSEVAESAVCLGVSESGGLVFVASFSHQRIVAISSEAEGSPKTEDGLSQFRL